MADTHPTDAAAPDAIYQLLIAARQLLYQAETLCNLADDGVTETHIGKAITAASDAMDTRIGCTPVLDLSEYLG